VSLTGVARPCFRPSSATRPQSHGNSNRLPRSRSSRMREPRQTSLCGPYERARISGWTLYRGTPYRRSMALGSGSIYPMAVMASADPPFGSVQPAASPHQAAGAAMRAAPSGLGKGQCGLALPCVGGRGRARDDRRTCPPRSQPAADISDPQARSGQSHSVLHACDGSFSLARTRPVDMHVLFSLDLRGRRGRPALDRAAPGQRVEQLQDRDCDRDESTEGSAALQKLWRIAFLLVGREVRPFRRPRSGR